MFNSLVKNVFLMLMGSTVALILYFVFFGVNMAPYGTWEGVLWWSARAVETPISRYYYEYCYLPNVYSSYYVDEALDGARIVSDIQDTPADLSSVDDLYIFTGSDHYSTGWR